VDGRPAPAMTGERRTSILSAAGMTCERMPAKRQEFLALRVLHYLRGEKSLLLS